MVIRGPGVMTGYVANPAATAEAFYGDWFRTGDLGVLRDGYLYLEGRIKELIIRGGENISPVEIEQVLLGHPAVRDAVCFGVGDDKYGELVGAAVTLTAEREAKSRRQGADRALPAAPGGVQGPVEHHDHGPDPAHRDRQGAAPPGRGRRGRAV